MPEYTDSEGNFTDEAREAFPGWLGDEHADSKVMNDIPGLSMLVQRHADTKSKLGEKMDSVIQKPAAEATEEQKAEYNKTLLTELGLASKPEDFDLPKPDLPEGMKYNEEQAADYRKWCLEHNIPKSIAKLYSEKYNTMRIDEFKGIQETAQKLADEREELFKTECEKLKEDWPGVDFTKNLRMALEAIKTFNKNNPELLESLAKSGLYEHPEDFEKWRESGLTPANLRGWQEIGAVLLNAEVLIGAPDASDQSARAKAMRQFPQSPDLWPIA